MSQSLFNYEGKHVLVVGAATGMGAAAANLANSLGARVTAMDIAGIDYDVDQSISLNLSNKASIDAAIDQIEGNVDVIFACAGVADGTPNIMLINFTGQRHLIDSLLAGDRINRGGSIVMISSVGGLPWVINLANVNEFLAATEWDAAVAWVEAHPGTDSYTFSKQAVSGYVAREALPLLKKGIRINAIQPGPTDTPLARANADIWLAFGQDYRDEAGVSHLKPEDMANVLAFLGSDAASGVSGVNMLVDQGQIGAGLTDAFPAPFVKAMYGLAVE